MPPRGRATKRGAEEADGDAPKPTVRRPPVAGGAPAPAAAEEEDWEDMNSSDGDDDDVDERFDQYDDGEVVVDDDDDDRSQADSDAAGAERSAPVKRVQFDEATQRYIEGPEGMIDEGNQPAEADDDAGQVWRRDRENGNAHGPLAYNNKAYDCFFQLKSEFPCLSFDVLRDNDGESRTKYPLSMYLVCGSQAEHASENLLYIIKVSNLLKTKHDVASDEDSEDDELFGADEDESDDDAPDAEEVNAGEPLVDYRTIKHHGTVNRLRCNPHHGSMVLTWSESGKVQVFDVASEFRAMSDSARWAREEAEAALQKKTQRGSLRFVSAGDTHACEGYGLAWSNKEPHVFATGDCAGGLLLWKPTDDGRWVPSPAAAATHGHSIEEIKFSHTEPNVFIVARAGGMCEVWDHRAMTKPRVSFRADPTDINVCDWNAATTSSHLLVTGADSGIVSVWDLRSLKKPEVPLPLQTLLFHQGNKITSVEFSRHNESVLSVTSDDGQCTLWDLSLERDAGEEKEVMGNLFGRPDTMDLPDQLMFQHQGLEHPKEAHFHPQIPGMTLTTDFHGLHLFKPMNWRSLMK